MKSKRVCFKTFKNVPVLDSGARGATNTFVQKKNWGCFTIAWKMKPFSNKWIRRKDEFEIVVPSVSILAEPICNCCK